MKTIALKLSALAALMTLTSACGGGLDSSVPPPPPAPVAVDNACLQAADSGNVTVGSGQPGDPSLPEPASGFKLGKKPVLGSKYMVSTANPLATAAGCKVLKAGGSAMDAAVAVQAVLGLVEPQSSGLGGGGFMLYYKASTKEVTAYDGRETAPAAATENYLRYVGDTAASGAVVPNARGSGRSIGTPGIVRMLELGHQEQGKLAWAGLFEDGIRLSADGFRMSGRMADAIVANSAGLLRDADAQKYFFNVDLTPKALGTLMKNPEYTEVLRAIANGGANAFHTGPIAQAMVDKIRVSSSVAAGTTAAAPMTPGLTTMADMAAYQPKKRTAVCTTYRGFEVCGMPPPSSGGIAVAQTLGMLENYDMSALRPVAPDVNGGKPTLQAVHLVSEAQRLAFADRNLYVADTDFVALPGRGVASLVDKTYLRQRAALINPARSMGTAVAGTFTGTATALGASANEGVGTSHVSIVDADGNALVLTTTVESSMGSYHMTRGFLLNNQLTDFSAAPTDAAGLPIANRIAPLKRPRSSMAPTLVFQRTADGSRGQLVMATGSPGGAAIILYVTKTVLGVLDWGLDAQQATSLVNFGSVNTSTTFVGGEHPNINAANNGDADALITGLRGLGHTTAVTAQPSGVSTITRGTVNGKTAWVGAADPRREGIALGDGAAP
jgi:gamma-glutamyltranspeptidase / glutathione hydrolase